MVVKSTMFLEKKKKEKKRKEEEALSDIYLQAWAQRFIVLVW